MEKFKVKFHFDNGNKSAEYEIEGSSQIDVLKDLTSRNGWYIIESENEVVNLDLVTRISFVKKARAITKPPGL